MYKSRIAILIFLAALPTLSSCSVVKTFAPDELYYDGVLLVSTPTNLRKLYSLPKKDIYAWFNILENPESAYKHLVNNSKKYADEKCGFSGKYKLINYGYTPRDLSKQRPSFIHADIKCESKTIVNGKDIKERTCKSLGFNKGTEKFLKCVNEL